MEKKLAIIGGTGMERFVESCKNAEYRDIVLSAEYFTHRIHVKKDVSAKLIIFENGNEVVFVNRHNVPIYEWPAELPEKLKYVRPDEIDYKTLMVALHSYGITDVISTSAVGSGKKKLAPGSMALCKGQDDYLNTDVSINHIIKPGEKVDEKTKKYKIESLDTDLRTYSGMCSIFDPALNSYVAEAAKQLRGELNRTIGLDAVYILMTRGPAFETEDEIKRARRDHVWKDLMFGMTVPTEAKLARLMGMRYATIATVTNYAADMVTEITHEENARVFSEAIPDFVKILEKTIDIYYSEKISKPTLADWFNHTVLKKAA